MKALLGGLGFAAGVALAVWDPSLIVFVIGLLVAVSITDVILFHWFVAPAPPAQRKRYRFWQYAALNFLPAILIWRVGYGLTPAIGMLAALWLGVQDFLYHAWLGKVGSELATQHWMDWTPYGAVQTFIRRKPIQTWAINLQAAVGVILLLTSIFLL